MKPSPGILVAIAAVFLVAGGCRQRATVERFPPPRPHRHVVIEPETPVPPAPVEARRTTYFYYPTSEVYYHFERRTYFWREDDLWLEGFERPARMRGDRSAPILIELEGDHPGEHHRRNLEGR